jgi:hypothetical protein
MSALNYGNVSIERDGASVTCAVSGVVVGKVSIDGEDGSRALSLVFSADHSYFLSLGETRRLLDIEETVVEASAVEPVAEEASVAVEAPATPTPLKRRR